ncbi:hypothetical protein [Sinorhizobium meliloti]|uniref:hypothetical protein n=1 Tax=Rhizobium meliloti TaxID=382 RepID=UPI000417AC55|nr:hypothetical protein [Sinorhizobium meliloti]ARS70116.1 hypothetical protein SMRU11_23985 [Sinorhizobium meliloti RU11/001]
MAVTSSEITSKLEALDRLTAQLGTEFDDAAALAVAGDAEAASDPRLIRAAIKEAKRRGYQ